MHTPTLHIVLVFLLATSAAHAGDLNIEISVPAFRQGHVMAALFDKADLFPRGTPLRTASVKAVQGKVNIRFADLPTGDYAISAYLDENSNAKLDTNFIGIPSEPYGFSRNARNLAGPPPFADAAFKVDASHRQLAFELK